MVGQPGQQLGTLGRVHHPGDESFGEGRGGEAELVRVRSLIYSRLTDCSRMSCLQSSPGKAAVRPGWSSKFLEGRACKYSWALRPEIRPEENQPTKPLRRDSDARSGLGIL